MYSKAGSQANTSYDVIVSELPVNVTKKQLLEFFSFFHPLSTSIDQVHETATISFGTEQDCENALTMDGTLFMGSPKPIHVTKANAADKLTVYVTTYPPGVTQEDLNIFLPFSPTATHLERGGMYATVTFSNQMAMEAALRLDGKVTKSKKFNVKPFKSKSKNANSTYQKPGPPKAVPATPAQKEVPKKFKKKSQIEEAKSQKEKKLYRLRISGFNFSPERRTQVVNESKRIFKMTNFSTINIDYHKGEIVLGYESIDGFRKGMTFHDKVIFGDHLSAEPIIGQRYEAVVSYEGRAMQGTFIEAVFSGHDYVCSNRISPKSCVFTFDNPNSLNRILAQDGVVVEGKAFKIVPAQMSQLQPAPAAKKPPFLPKAIAKTENKLANEKKEAKLNTKPSPPISSSSYSDVSVGAQESGQTAYMAKFIGFTGTLDGVTRFLDGLRPTKLSKISKKTRLAYFASKADLLKALEYNKRTYKDKLILVKRVLPEANLVQAFVNVKNVPPVLLGDPTLKNAVLSSLKFYERASSVKSTKRNLKIFFKNDQDAIAFEEANKSIKFAVEGISVHPNVRLCPRLNNDKVAAATVKSSSSSKQQQQQQQQEGDQGKEQTKDMKETKKGDAGRESEASQNISTTLHVSGLPLDTTNKDFLALFKPYGCITGSVVGKKKTSGFVIFKTPEAAQRAYMEFNGAVVADSDNNNYTLKVFFMIKKKDRQQERKDKSAAKMYPTKAQAFHFVKLSGLVTGNKKADIASILNVDKKACFLDMVNSEGTIYVPSEEEVKRLLDIGSFTLSQGNVVSIRGKEDKGPQEEEIKKADNPPRQRPHVVHEAISSGAKDATEDIFNDDSDSDNDDDDDGDSDNNDSDDDFDNDNIIGDDDNDDIANCNNDNDSTGDDDDSDDDDDESDSNDSDSNSDNDNDDTSEDDDNDDNTSDDDDSDSDDSDDDFDDI